MVSRYRRAGTCGSLLLACLICGVETRRPPAHVRRVQTTFCSRKCANVFQRQRRITKNCKVCGTPFQVRPCEDRKFSTCGAHRRFAKQREWNGNWKGGITKSRKAAMSTKEYKAWRRAVFERDDYRCQGCRTRGGDLEAHHIKPWVSHPDLRYDVDNGETLCLKCHRETFKRTA